MTRGDQRRRRVSRMGFGNPGLEGVSGDHATVFRAVLEVFCQQERAPLRLGCRDDEAIPPVELKSPLDLVRSRQYFAIDILRFPLQQFTHVVPGDIPGDPESRSLGE
jgi:hypothetical protein